MRASLEPKPRTETAGEWPTRAAELIGWAAAVVAIAIAAVRVLIPYAPRLYWNIDPRALEEPITQLGPTGAAVTDWLAVASLALAVVAAALRRDRIHWLLIGLWAIGGAFIIFHGIAGLRSLRIGGHWLAALALALAALHLGRDPHLRRLMQAAVIALLVPLSLQALHQVTIEHTQTVREYERSEQQILESRGWSEGSTSHRQYERRLYQIEARGPFGLANVFGTVLITTTLAAAGAAVALLVARRRDDATSDTNPAKRDPLRYALIGVALLGPAVLASPLVMDLLGYGDGVISKGVVGALLVAAGVPVGAWWVGRRRRLGAGWWRAAVLGAVGIVLAMVVVRGLMGPPETAEGERSLLFRWYYMQGAASMWAEHPFAGVGPGQFKQHYLIHKPPRSPEEVSDPHSVFAAYLSTLGLGGLALSALLVALLWRGATAAGLASVAASPTDPEAGNRSPKQSSDPESEDPAPERSSDPPSRRRWRWAAVAVMAAVVFGTVYTLRFTALGPVPLVVIAIGLLGLLMGGKAMREGTPQLGWPLVIVALAVPVGLLPSVGLWLVGAVVFIAITGLLSGRRELDAPLGRLALLPPALAVAIHGQIDMALTHPMAAPLVLLVVGLAATGTSASASSTERAVPGGVRHPALWIGAAAALVLAGLLGAHTVPIALSEHRMKRSALTLRSGLGGDMTSARASAISLLPSADAYPPDARRAIEGAKLLLEQARVADRAGRSQQRDRSLNEAMERLDRARATGLDPASVRRTEIRIARAAYPLTRNPAWRQRAFQAATSLVEHAPNSIRDHVLAGDAAWGADQRNQALEWYRWALRLSELAYLDPTKPLSEEELRHVESRVGRTGQSTADGADAP